MTKFVFSVAMIITIFFHFSVSTITAKERPTREPVSKMAFMNGSWIVTPSTKDKNGTWQEQESRSFADFEFTLDRNIIEGDLSPLPPLNYHSRMFITYDVVRSIYRVLSMDDYWGWVLVMTGNFKENGDLVVTNLGTDTSWRNGQGGWTDTRMDFKSIDENHARITHILSNDGGKTWDAFERLDLRRRYAK